MMYYVLMNIIFTESKQLGLTLTFNKSYISTTPNQTLNINKNEFLYLNLVISICRSTGIKAV